MTRLTHDTVVRLTKRGGKHLPCDPTTDKRPVVFRQRVLMRNALADIAAKRDRSPSWILKDLIDTYAVDLDLLGSPDAFRDGRGKPTGGTLKEASEYSDRVYFLAPQHINTLEALAKCHRLTPDQAIDCLIASEHRRSRHDS